MEKQTIAKPQGLTDEHLEYLDELRQSGRTNMFGAAPYIQMEFGLERDDAKAYLLYWMRTFSARQQQGGAA